MARTVAGAICLAVLATPAFAAGDAFQGAPWIGAIFTGGMIAFFGFLALGSGFFLGSLLKFSMTVLVILLVALILPIYVYLTLDLGRTIAVATAEALMLLFFSPTIVWGWWLGRKDATRRSNRTTALNAGSSHG
jgi:hypothetical protein